MRRSILGAAPDFTATEALRTLALDGRAGQKLELAQGLRAERTAAELRLAMGPDASREKRRKRFREYSGDDSRRDRAPAFGLRLRIEIAGPEAWPGERAATASRAVATTAQLEAWRPGAAALLGRPAQGEGSAGAAAGYGKQARAFGRCWRWMGRSCGCRVWSWSRSRDRGCGDRAHETATGCARCFRCG